MNGCRSKGVCVNARKAFFILLGDSRECSPRVSDLDCYQNKHCVETLTLEIITPKGRNPETQSIADYTRSCIFSVISSFRVAAIALVTVVKLFFGSRCGPTRPVE